MNNIELKKERKRLGLSIRQLSQLTGYSGVWISHFEFGEKRVSTKFIQAYEEALASYRNILKKGK